MIDYERQIGHIATATDIRQALVDAAGRYRSLGNRYRDDTKYEIVGNNPPDAEWAILDAVKRIDDWIEAATKDAEALYVKDGVAAAVDAAIRAELARRAAPDDDE